jgi:serine protease Do
MALLAFGGGCSRMGEGNVALPDPAEGPVERTVPANSEGRSVVSYSPVVKRASPAVVTIRSARVVRQPRQFPFMDHPWFGDRSNAVPQQRQAPQLQSGLGSGVIVTPDGYILTNHHVVDGAELIRVVTVDRRSFEARVVGSDSPSDLAVLKIEAQDLAVLNLGNSDTVEVGDVVLALGNPLGLEQTVTAGIISAKGRSTGLSDGSFEDFLQTDAPINQGNSGGALINTAGELVGINSQILSPTGGNIGIGFAIPSNMARNVMEQLIRTGSVRRGMLGVVVQPVTADIAQQQNMPEPRGIVIAAVQPGGPAASAGLREGDIITALNNEPVNESNHLRNRIASLAPGTEVTLTVFRSGAEQQIRATLGEVQPTTAGNE